MIWIFRQVSLDNFPTFLFSEPEDHINFINISAVHSYWMSDLRLLISKAHELIWCCRRAC